jgi:metacaspase-1
MRRIAHLLGSLGFVIVQALPGFSQEATPGAGQVRALLVGVSDYLYLAADLRGPRNDVRLMAAALVARGVPAEAITVLSADGESLPAGVATGLPTRAEILAGLDSLAAVSRADDTAIFYFSGHGSQAPDASGDEQGGYDEILLPMDATGWKGAIGMVENAILDDELQERAQAILDRGARLVGVIDACHSATGFRALGGEGAARALPPEALGIPEDAVSAPAGAVSPPLTGEFVFLYSSQSDQRSFEYPLGEAADPGNWYGEFTRQLSTVLQAAPQASWAQVLAATSDAMRQGTAQQTPDGEGPLLGTAVFGAAEPPERFSVVKGKVQAGGLWGLTEGSIVELYAAAAGGEPLMRARLGATRPGDADLVADAGGTLPADGYAELIRLAPPPPLRLAAPVRRDAVDPVAYDAIEAALAAAQYQGIFEPAAVGSADLVPILTEGVLALAGADGVLDPAGPGSSSRVARDDEEAWVRAVERVLSDAAFVIRWQKALGDAARASGGLKIGGPAIEMSISRRPGIMAADGSCTGAGEAVPFDPSVGAGHCDQLWLDIVNTSGKAQDVTVFYRDRDFGIDAMWPRNDLSNRLALGEAARVGMRIEYKSGGGIEEIVLVAMAANAGDRRADLSRIANQGVTRGVPLDGLASYFDGVMFDRAVTRDFGWAPKLSPFTVLRQPVRLIPRP